MNHPILSSRSFTHGATLVRKTIKHSLTAFCVGAGLLALTMPAQAAITMSTAPVGSATNFPTNSISGANGTRSFSDIGTATGATIATGLGESRWTTSGVAWGEVFKWTGTTGTVLRAYSVIVDSKSTGSYRPFLFDLGAVTFNTTGSTFNPSSYTNLLSNVTLTPPTISAQTFLEFDFSGSDAITLTNGRSYAFGLLNTTTGNIVIRRSNGVASDPNGAPFQIASGGLTGTSATVPGYGAGIRNLFIGLYTTTGATAPAAPTGLTATAGSTQVSLSWTASSGATSYNVKRATTSGGPYTTVASPTTTSYVNTGLTNGTTYYYVVTAVNASGESANSTQASATPNVAAPAAPTGLNAVSGNAQASLTWTASSGATSYNVKRATTSGGPYTTIASPTTTSYVNTGLTNGTTYYFVVSAVNAGGESANSAPASATPVAAIPAAPTGLTATAGNAQVSLSWTASSGATSYNVKRATTSGGPYTTVASPTTTSYVNTGLTNGTTYYFVVSAVNAGGQSGNSSQVSAVPTGGGSTPPYVYSVENTGAGFPLPPLPALAACPLIQPLPDPFAWADDPLNANGTRSTAFADWSEHRSEIKAQIENYEIGTKPAVNIASQVTASFSGNTLTVNVTANGQTMTLTCAVSIPAGAVAPYPVCIGMNGAYGSVGSSQFTSRGIASIVFSHDQVTTYNNPQLTNPFYRLYPTQNLDNSGQYSAWAWGVSRIIDGLTLVQGSLPVDLQRIAVTGCSYAGKMALFSGAFDERIALTIAQESGGGGATSWRYSATQTNVEGLAQTSHQWFRESMFQFGGANVSYLPVDHHMLMAMCAPRALFVTGNTDYGWLSNQSAYVCGQATARIYSELGIADRFGFYIDGAHGHCVFPTAQNASLQYFLDKFMKGQTALSQTVRTAPSTYSTIDYARWSQWWGTSNPVLPP